MPGRTCPTLTARNMTPRPGRASRRTYAPPAAGHLALKRLVQILLTSARWSGPQSRSEPEWRQLQVPENSRCIAIASLLTYHGARGGASQPNQKIGVTCIRAIGHDLPRSSGHPKNQPENENRSQPSYAKCKKCMHGRSTPPPCHNIQDNRSTLSISFGISNRKNRYIPYRRNPSHGWDVWKTLPKAGVNSIGKKVGLDYPAATNTIEGKPLRSMTGFERQHH